MTEQNQKQLGTTLWGIADSLRGAMNADDFRDYMLNAWPTVASFSGNGTQAIRYLDREYLPRL